MSICELGNKCVRMTDSNVCLMTSEISVARLISWREPGAVPVSTHHCPQEGSNNHAAMYMVADLTIPVAFGSFLSLASTERCHAILAVDNGAIMLGRRLSCDLSVRARVFCGTVQMALRR